MKVLLIGHTGTIGKAVCTLLAERGHSVVRASRSGGDASVDITDHGSIVRMYEHAGGIDAVMIAAGSTPYKHISELTTADFVRGWQCKALGQIDVALTGMRQLYDGGSITLISGILSRTPIARGTVASTVNGAIEKFVMAAATEAPSGIRINAVSPTVVSESLASYEPYFPGFKPVPAKEVAMAYVRSLEGIETGKVFEV